MASTDLWLPGITGVCTRSLDLEEPFHALAARFAHEPGCVVLLSGGPLDSARYHLLAIRPWFELSGRTGGSTITIDGTAREDSREPLDLLDVVLKRCHLETGETTDPIRAGLFGYLAYDLKDSLEHLPRTAVDDLGLPHMLLYAPSLIVVHDKVDGRTLLHAPIRQDLGIDAAEGRIEDFLDEIGRPAPVPGGFSGTGKAFTSNFSREAYEAAVERIRDYIAAGDVYQVNLSQRFEMGFAGDAYSLFSTLYQMNPAPFFAYINAGDHQIVSTSPERFLQQRGRRVETRPIKGTRPRGQTPEADRQMQAALSESPKDDAELSMIVDLMRNDVGRVCSGGSVVVSQHKRMEAYRNVYHLVSVVEGTLAEGRGAVDLIRATFPGGSITGCPKIRCMEIIDELESRRRHVYTGSIGYISFHDTMDLSIAIRTATVVDKRILFSVGGGIVFDSDPADEFVETLHKGETLMRVFRGADKAAVVEKDGGPWAWMDGRIISQAEAMVPATDLGLQYGFGFFETIRVEKGAACRLAAHLERFNRSWTALFGSLPPDLTWEDIITQVVTKNSLEKGAAAVKLLATRGDTAASRFNGTLLVTARPYVHRLTALGRVGLNLITYPAPRLTHLADHKTLNYLFYYLAGAWAREKGADEAVVLNPDGSLSETNTASILVVSGKTVLRPRSPHALPGVMQAAVCRWFAENGFSLADQAITPQSLADADTVLLTNALMGPVPALSLDGRPLHVEHRLCEQLAQWFSGL
ncbi:hypothetical protein DSCO28_45430 [Desulfosarcina ovata subsp. sediminis]|uniref:aminodeoxychorismate synthase n=1 Tax=Desulfosarcina ovata subsp. sediminis TaxID=885957 RepID=A0A5K7ZUR4_9BACT|nr:aminodeoxychorismate synthase component I [Desulfosarcina ovata]BBO83977.1 hypothetical protein DSCO28_45430 [Desulfosarcina ovata subsp. sediminis]